MNARAQNYIRQSSPLSDDQIRRVAPSVFAESPHESRSSRYTYIPTSTVLQALRREGFEPYAAAQSRSRIEGKEEYTKHMLRLRPSADLNPSVSALSVGDTINEIVLVNSHDGTSSYQMMAGLYRLVCTNGMVVCQGNIEDIRIPHKGDVTQSVIEGAYTVLDQFERVAESKDRMQGIDLKPAQQGIFAKAALSLKYDTPEDSPINSEQLLTARRHDDKGSDLWHTFNRAQENLLRGGLRGRAASGRRSRTREVTGVSENMRLNRALWMLADEMAKLAA